MRMDEGLDTGPVCCAEPVPIGPDTTAGELHDLLSTGGAGLMVRALSQLERGALVCAPQPAEGATYAPKIDKGEARLDFMRPALEVHNQVRGLSPAPGAWFEGRHQGRLERVKVLRTQVVAESGPPGTVLDAAPTVACGDGAVRLLEVQRAGKKPMAAAEFLRGLPLPPGTRLQAPH
jgi:methionyl-tRNA formyltransferase